MKVLPSDRDPDRRDLGYDSAGGMVGVRGIVKRLSSTIEISVWRDGLRFCIAECYEIKLKKADRYGI